MEYFNTASETTCTLWKHLANFYDAIFLAIRLNLSRDGSLFFGQNMVVGLWTRSALRDGTKWYSCRQLIANERIVYASWWYIIMPNVIYKRLMPLHKVWPFLKETSLEFEYLKIICSEQRKL